MRWSNALVALPLVRGQVGQARLIVMLLNQIVIISLFVCPSRSVLKRTANQRMLSRVTLSVLISQGTEPDAISIRVEISWSNLFPLANKPTCAQAHNHNGGHQ